MSKVEELARQYAEQQVKDSPNNEYKGYSFELQKELTKFDGYDIEQAYEDGYKQAEKDNALSWEDIKLIGELFQNVARDGRANKDLEASFKEDLDAPFKEILRRFLEQKGGKV